MISYLPSHSLPLPALLGFALFLPVSSFFPYLLPSANRAVRVSTGALAALRSSAQKGDAIIVVTLPAFYPTAILRITT